MSSRSQATDPAVLLRRYLAVAPLSRALIRSRELEFVERAEFGPRMIDLGHGDGIFAVEAGRLGARVFAAVDFSLSESIRAKRRGSAKHYVVGDIERLPFRDGVFSGAMSNCVLEHIDDLDRCLIETMRVLYPTGCYMATVVTDSYEDLLLWPRIFRRLRLNGLAQAYLGFLRRRFRHVRYFSAEKWIKTARRSGFQIDDAVPYVGRLRQTLMDLFLPFIYYSLLNNRIFGRPVLIRRRWPAGFLTKILRDERNDLLPRRNANLALFLRRPALNRST